jgi:hypothetical protein
MPKGQPRRGEADFEYEYERARALFDDQFGDVAEMLDALAYMTTSMLDIRRDSADHSFGVHLIHKLIMRQFHQAVETAEDQIAELTAAVNEAHRQYDHATRNRAERTADGALHSSGVWLLLTGRLITIVLNAWREAGIEPDEGNQEQRRKVIGMAEDFGRKIMDQLEDRSDPVEAGSFLPWAEMKIRQELLGDKASEVRAD